MPSKVDSCRLDGKTNDVLPDGVYGNLRFMHTTCMLLGCPVRIQTKDGRLFEGIFRSFSQKFDVALECVHEVSGDTESGMCPSQQQTQDKMIFELNDVVMLTTTTDLDSVIKSGFATDADIARAARTNGEFSERQFEAWVPDDDHHVDHLLDSDGGHSVGWSAEDMFDKNAKLGVTSSFSDDLSQYTTVNIVQENTPEFAARQAEAERLAREIENNPAYLQATMLENTDEERDIVQNTNSNKYVPPQQRQTRGGRGGGRNRGAVGGRGGPDRRGGDVRNYGRHEDGGSQFMRGGGVPGASTRYSAPYGPQSYGGQYADNRDNDWERRRRPQEAAAFARGTESMMNVRPERRNAPPSRGKALEDLKQFHSKFNLATSTDFAHPPGGNTNTTETPAAMSESAPRTQAASAPAEGALHTPPKERPNQQQPQAGTPIYGSTAQLASPNKPLQPTPAQTAVTRLDDTCPGYAETVVALATHRQAVSGTSQNAPDIYTATTASPESAATPKSTLNPEAKEFTPSNISNNNQQFYQSAAGTVAVATSPPLTYAPVHHQMQQQPQYVMQQPVMATGGYSAPLLNAAALGAANVAAGAVYTTAPVNNANAPQYPVQYAAAAGAPGNASPFIIQAAPLQQAAGRPPPRKPTPVAATGQPLLTNHAGSPYVYTQYAANAAAAATLYQQQASGGSARLATPQFVTPQAQVPAMVVEQGHATVAGQPMQFYAAGAPNNSQQQANATASNHNSATPPTPQPSPATYQPPTSPQYSYAPGAQVMFIPQPYMAAQQVYSHPAMGAGAGYPQQFFTAGTPQFVLGPDHISQGGTFLIHPAALTARAVQGGQSIQGHGLPNV